MTKPETQPPQKAPNIDFYADTAVLCTWYIFSIFQFFIFWGAAAVLLRKAYSLLLLLLAAVVIVARTLPKDHVTDPVAPGAYQPSPSRAVTNWILLCGRNALSCLVSFLNVLAQYHCL